MAGSISQSSNQAQQPLPLVRPSVAPVSGASFAPVLAGLLEAVNLEVNAKSATPFAAPKSSSSLVGDTADASGDDEEGAVDVSEESTEPESSATNDTPQADEVASDDVSDTLPSIGELEQLLVAAPVAQQADTTTDTEAPVETVGPEVEATADSGTGSDSPLTETELGDDLAPLPGDTQLDVTEGAPEIQDVADPVTDSGEVAAPSVNTGDDTQAPAENVQAGRSGTPRRESVHATQVADDQSGETAESPVDSIEAQFVADAESAEAARPQAQPSTPQRTTQNTPVPNNTQSPIPSGNGEQARDFVPTTADAPADAPLLVDADVDAPLAPNSTNPAPSVFTTNNPALNIMAAQVAGVIPPASAPQAVQGAQGTGSGTGSTAGVNSIRAAGAASSGSEGGQGQQHGGDLGSQNSQAAQRAAGASKPRFSNLLTQRQHETVQQVARAIGLRGVIRSGSNMSLLLKPESLGTLRIDVEYDADGELSVKATADNMATRHLLAGASDELRAALREYQIELVKFVVEHRADNGLGQPGANGFGGAQAGNNFGRNSSGNGGEVGSGSAISAEDSAEELDAGPLRMGEVDVTA